MKALAHLTDRQLLEAIYRDVIAKIDATRLETAALRGAIGRLERATEATAGRVDALISDYRTLRAAGAAE